MVHGHHRRYGNVYVNQGEEYALRLLELEANFLSIFFIFFESRVCRITHVHAKAF